MHFLNSHSEPFLDFAKQQRQHGNWSFAPWTTSDPELLQLAADYFPEIPILSSEQLEKPDLAPVKLLPLSSPACPKLENPASFFIAVGGPPAAAVALEAAFQGESVLFICDSDLDPHHQTAPAIWTGAGNHGEPDALTQAPAFIVGYRPFTFIFKQLRQFLFARPPQKTFLDPDYPWLNLNVKEWLQNPRQWFAGLRLAWGNHQLAKEHALAMKQQGTSPILEAIKKRAHASGAYLEQLNQKLGGLLRRPRGSLLIATSAKQLTILLRNAAALEKEGSKLIPLTAEEAKQKYGIAPRGALALMEKPQDFIFEPQFLSTLTQNIKAQGGQVITHWRLTRVFIDTEQHKGGILEFYELTPNQEKKFHYRKFHHAHLSLGPRPFTPRIYDLINVTGVSMNALLFGVKLSGGPVVCGGSNHVVPLLPPVTINYKEPITGKTYPLDLSFVRLSAAGAVNPLDRGKNWHCYDGRFALHLLHRVQESLPETALLQLLSVRGCNRVIGKDGRQVELHPVLSVDHQKVVCRAVTIQMGAGGGGLTQMGAVPQQMVEAKSKTR